MRPSASKQIRIWAAAALLTASASGTSRAEDFFTALFGGFRAPQRDYQQQRLPFANDSSDIVLPHFPSSSSPPARSYGGGQAYCVRTCDGRYFPISAAEGRSKAASCNSFCPASETKVVYGSNIDNAATESGKLYSDLPNAFKYRNEIVDGCTCNGKDHFGLASVKVEDDPTLRKGDIVAGADGLMVATRTERRHGELNFSPAAPSIRAKYQRAPVLASD